MMNKIMLSGATSMVGVALIEECIKNKVKVVALVRKGTRNIQRIPNSEYVVVKECDLSEMRHFQIEESGFDVFFHLGWSNTDKANRFNVDKQMENIQYSLDAINLAVRLGCKRFIGAGSQAEYGTHKEEKTSENTPLEPKEAYGICKMSAGKLCAIEAKRLGIDFAWVRIFSLYGKYELSETLIQTTLPKMLHNEKCSFTEGIHKWDYLYGEDAGRAFYMIGDKAKGIKFYCLGSGKACPLREYILKMKEITNSTSELGFGDIPYGTDVPYGICADISLLKKEIGWEPQFTFAEGISREVERIRKEKNRCINEENKCSSANL